MAIAKWIPFGTPQISSGSQPAKPPVVPAISSADTKKFGLENFGNTCYANSVLQALYFCIPFRELLLQYTDPSVSRYNSPLPLSSPQAPATATSPRWKLERKASSLQTADVPSPVVTATVSIPSAPPTLFSALRSLFLFISKNPAEKGTVAPRAFIDKLKEVNELFRSTMHQDAHEFSNYLLNKIVEEMEQECDRKASDLSSSRGTNSHAASTSSRSTQATTLVHRLFEGVLTSETRCMTCENVSSRDEAFLDLSVDIEQNSSISACLRQFSASEMLCQKNKFFCDSCCDLQEAEKRMKIKKLPNVLALHLKRFKYQEDLQKYIKLAYRVAFPLELRLFNTVDDTEDADRLFSLFAIVVHIGNGPHHGHYISIIKTMAGWMVFDDDAVEQLRESDISRYFGDSNAGSAYVLYYQAVDLNLAAIGLQTTAPDVTEQVHAVVQPQVIPGSPIQTAPALPPGLTEENDSSHFSEPSTPADAAVSQLSTPETPALPATGEDPTSNTGATDDYIASTTHSISPINLKTGFLKSLRRTPSSKAGTSVPDPSASPTDKQSDATSATLSVPRWKSDSQPPPVPPLPVAANGDDKDHKKVPRPPTKESERKPSTWFNLKGTKAERARRSMPPPVKSQGSFNAEQDKGPSSSPGAWFKSSGSSPKKHNHGVNRQPSELSMSDMDALNTFGFPPKTTKARPDPPARRQRNNANGYESHSAGSATSSIGSMQVIPPVDFASTRRPSTSSRSSPRQSSTRSRSPSTRAGTSIDKGKERVPSPMPSTGRGIAAQGLATSPSTPWQWVATPGSDSYASSSTSAASPLVSRSPPVAHANGGAGGGIDRLTTPSTEDLPEEWQRLEMFPPRSAGIGAFPTPDRSPAPAANIGRTRTKRKLSLSAPILFGRRDRDKQKERDHDKERDKERERGREKDRGAPLSSLVGYSMAARM